MKNPITGTGTGTEYTRVSSKFKENRSFSLAPIQSTVQVERIVLEEAFVRFPVPYLDSNADPLLENSAQVGCGETGPVVQGQRTLCTQGQKQKLVRFHASLTHKLSVDFNVPGSFNIKTSLFKV
jgi:hypothetical protein